MGGRGRQGLKMKAAAAGMDNFLIYAMPCHASSSSLETNDEPDDDVIGISRKFLLFCATLRSVGRSADD